MVDMYVCRKVGLFYCTAGDCPCTDSDRFFTSKEALRRHNRDYHPATIANAQTSQGSAQQPAPPPNVTLCQQRLTDPTSAQPAQWERGLRFISLNYEHDPPDFRSNWYHWLKNSTRSSWNLLLKDIITATIQSSADTATSLYSS